MANQTSKHESLSSERRETLSPARRGTGSIQKVAFLGTHLPRRCGIATFTSDLSTTIAQSASDIECMVVAMNDPGKSYAYPASVRFEIAEGELAGYRRAAQFVNAND